MAGVSARRWRNAGNWKTFVRAPVCAGSRLNVLPASTFCPVTLMVLICSYMCHKECSL